MNRISEFLIKEIFYPSEPFVYKRDELDCAPKIGQISLKV